MIGVLNMTIVSIATGLIVSAIWLSIVWHRVRRPGESWEDARKREMSHLDRLAEQEVQRDAKRSGSVIRDVRNAELAEIPDTVRSFEDRSIN